jgi:hypothetical protein
MEHRLADRFAVDLPIEIVSAGRIVRGHTRNVSKDGALLETEAGPLSYQSHIQLALRPTGAESHRLRSVVIHREDAKLGVMFLDTWDHAEWEALRAGATTTPSG